MFEKTIILVGPFPPPIGGVSVHTSRLISHIEDQHIVYKIDTSKNKLVQIFLLLTLLIKSLKKDSDFILHNHVFKMKFNVILIFICNLFGVKYLQTVHSFRLNSKQLSNTEIGLIKYILKKADNTIVVSKKIKDDLIQYDNNLSNKITVIPAFIPYKKNEKAKDTYINCLGIEKFLKSHKIILCANASKIVFYNDEDLYGIDLCINLMEKIKKRTTHNVGFIFMLPQISNKEYYNKMKSYIFQKGLEEDFIFINKEADLVPLFDYVDIFLRPTNTDGDALSIREALHSGLPCIASDIVERPVGTVTFKNRDIEDFFRKTSNILSNLNEEKKKIRQLNLKQEDTLKGIFNIYD